MTGSEKYTHFNIDHFRNPQNRLDPSQIPCSDKQLRSKTSLINCSLQSLVVIYIVLSIDISPTLTATCVNDGRSRGECDQQLFRSVCNNDGEDL